MGNGKEIFIFTHEREKEIEWERGRDTVNWTDTGIKICRQNSTKNTFSKEIKAHTCVLCQFL